MRLFVASIRTVLCVGWLCAAGSVWARQDTPQFSFARAGSTTPLTTLTVGQNETFTVSLFYQYQPTTPFTYQAVNVFVGFDQATTAGSSATPQTGRISFAAGQNQNTAVGNVNPDFVNLQPNGLGGGQDPVGQTSSALRPYGVDVSLEAANGISGFSGTGPSPVRLFDFTLRNVSLAQGQTQQLTVYTSGNTDTVDYDTYLTDGVSFVRPATSFTLTLVGGAAVIPEPSTLGLILLGALAGLPFQQITRKRKQLLSAS